MDSKTLSPPSVEDVTVEDCEAVLICLSTRRFVVARPGEPRDFVADGWRLG